MNLYIKRLLFSLFLSLFVMAHFSVAPAFARSKTVKVCQKKSVSGAGKVFKMLARANKNARRAWRLKVKRKYGIRWASWQLARKGFQNCEIMPNFKKKGSVGGFYCLATAITCRRVRRGF